MPAKKITAKKVAAKVAKKSAAKVEVKRGRPTRAAVEERERVERRAAVSRDNFVIFSLQGMVNTNRHIISKVVSARDVEWFETCIEYMMEKVRAGKQRRKTDK